MKKGTFVIKHAEGSFRFDLLADDGLVLCRSEVYASEAECREAIEDVRRCCVAELEDRTAGGCGELACPKYEMNKYGENKFEFKLKNAEGEVIASCGGFAADYTCARGAEKVRRLAPDAEVIVPTYIGGSVVGGQAANV